MAFVITPTGIAGTGSVGTPTIQTVQISDFETMLEEDLEEVFIPSGSEDFATEAAYIHSTGESAVYPCLFDNPGVSVSTPLDADFRTVKPQIRVQSSKLLRPIKKDDKITVKGIPYFVEDFDPDGFGLVVIFLRTK